MHQVAFHLDQLRVVIAPECLIGGDTHRRGARAGLLPQDDRILQHRQILTRRTESHHVQPIARCDRKTLRCLNEESSSRILDVDGPLDSGSVATPCILTRWPVALSGLKRIKVLMG